jgi:predicted nucleotidyltransferase
MLLPPNQSQTFCQYDREEISEIVKRLVPVYDPISIYLFGSYAWGTPDKDSDYDLCVVIDNCEKSRKPRSLEGYKALKDMKKRNAVDIVVYTAKNFEHAITHPSTMASIINKKGVLLYDRTIQRITVSRR